MKNPLHRRLWKGSGTARRRYAAVRAATRPVSRLRRRRAARGAAGGCSDPTTGFWAPPPGLLPDTAELVKATLERVEQIPIPADRRKEHMWQGYLDGVRLGLDSPFLRFALHPAVVDMVTDYLGEVPVLASIEIWKSWWAPDHQATMNWHLDWDDVTQLKVYVFASDVQRENGPTHAIDAKRSARLAERIRYDFFGDLQSYMLSDSDMERELGSLEATAFTGPPGTVAALDPSRCFHMGGRMASPHDHRILTIFQYLRLGAPTLAWNPRRAPFAGLARRARLDRRSRLVLGAI